MANLNRIILVGRLTSDPETRSTMDGLAMAKFRMAVARPGAGRNESDFIDVVAWQRVAETCSDSLKKGQLVLVEGRIQNRSFEDQTGRKRWVTEVVARNVQMLEKPKVQSSKSPVDVGHSIQDAGHWTEDEAMDDESLSSDLPF